MKGSEPIKILSYNLHLGRSAFRKKAIEESLVQTIHDLEFHHRKRSDSDPFTWITGKKNGYMIRKKKKR
jgi:hypothetical protein